MASLRPILPGICLDEDNILHIHVDMWGDCIPRAGTTLTTADVMAFADAVIAVLYPDFSSTVPVEITESPYPFGPGKETCSATDYITHLKQYPKGGA